MTPNKLHQPVLLQEAITALDVKRGSWYVDATFGRGGHTAQIIKLEAKVVAFDHDAEAIKYGQEKFAPEIEQGNLILIRENFDQIFKSVSELTKRGKVDKIRGAIFDFGTSVDQLKSPTRGFSFDQPAPLDMRMDDRLGVTAYDLLYLLSEKQLTQTLKDFGGEESAKAIAKAIAKYKAEHQSPPKTTQELAELVAGVKSRQSHLHPATKTFQALRIAVNSELDAIAKALPQAFELLQPKGRLVTISFHQGEDRLCKTFFKSLESRNLAQILTKKPITPTPEEITLNPRSRSAKLRAVLKYEKKAA